VRLFLFITILSILFSCNSDLKEEIIYYPNGKIHRKHFLNSKGEIEGKAIEYDRNGFVSAIFQFKKGELVDSLMFFKENKIESIIYLKNNDTKLVKKFENDKLVSKGIIKNNQKNGKWEFYKNGKISKIIEYIDLCGIEYLNQGWVYDDNGKLNLNESNFVEISNLKKIYRIDEPIMIKMKYNSIWNVNSTSVVQYHIKVDSNFCNLEKIKVDEKTSKNHFFDLKIGFDESGKYNVRGVIIEKNNEVDMNRKSNVRELYFDIPIMIE
jgi:hypothetical protein